MVLLVVLVGSASAAPVAAQDQRCFPETGQCISGPIRTYWERNGGLPVFGFPTTVQTVEDVEGVALQVQWFERDRLEIQPDGRVTAGRLGARLLELRGTPWQQGPNQAGAGCRVFAETGHQICGKLRTYWERNGGLERFGFPLTGEFSEATASGTFVVQYFERRRMELHPENAPPFDVLLGLLGNEVRALSGGAPAPAPAPAPQPTPAPQPPPPSYNACQEDPRRNEAPNYPVRIVTVNKVDETVTLQNVSPNPVDLTGWIMCSIRGNQQHPINGVLAPGEQRVFPGPRGNIWSNSEKDDGALYNPAGQLISYWDDPRR